jgi:hypothetical protein
MKITFGVSLFLLALGFTACSGGGGGSGDNGGGSGGPSAEKEPQSKEEALQKLSSQHKANFEAWQNKVVKACDSADAFGLNPDKKAEPDGIDGATLIKKNNGSVVFSDGKNLAILTGYKGFSGVGITKINEEVNVNGQGYKISIETKREGLACTVFLFGQKVYETVIVESFTVGAQYSQDKEASVTSQNPILKEVGVNGSAEVFQHGLYTLLSETLKPSKKALEFIGQIFGLSLERSEKLFKLDDSTSVDSAVRIVGDHSSVWNYSKDGVLVSQVSILKKIFDGTSRGLNLEVRLQLPQFDFRGAKNTADNGTLKLEMGSTIIKKDNGFLITTNSLQNNGFVPFNQAEAQTCARDRVGAYLRPLVGHSSISPSIQVMFSPCRIIFPDIESLSYKNGFLKSRIPLIFANLTPSSQFLYGGWDFVLSRLAKEAVTQNKDIVSELDPNANTEIVGQISNHLAAIKEEVENSKNMLASKEVALQMGLDWSFKGIVVSPEKISQIIKSVDNSADVFKFSSHRLLDDLAQNPNTNDAQLLYALAIDSTFKSEAMEALKLSRDLNYSNFESYVFNQVIQKRVTIDELKSWSDRLSAVKTDIDKVPAVSSVKGELVESSLKWLKTGEVSAQDLSGIYSAIGNSIDPFVESTKKLVHDLDQSFADNKPALEFARNMTGEYKQLALSIQRNSTSAESENWGSSFFNSVLQKRPAIEQLRQWNDLWISVLAFVQREKARVIGDLGTGPAWNREKVIEVAVKETWSGQEFAALEAIASVSKSMTRCGRYKDASSQADCAGMDLFSRGQGKFFDPTYGGRYTSLAAEFTGYTNRLSGDEWFSLRRALLDKFFDSPEPIWSKCDSSSFNQKASVLKGQVRAIAGEVDQLKKWTLERKIKETIENCQ